MPDFIFNLPSDDILTDIQDMAIYDTNSIIVSGGPGTGKTVVTLKRFIRTLNNDSIDAILFTYNRTLMTNIKGFIRQNPDIFDEIEAMNFASKIKSLYQWYYNNVHAYLSEADLDDINRTFENHAILNHILVDEAQDFGSPIISNLHQIGQKITCGTDRAQNLQGRWARNADEEIIQILRRNRTIVKHTLDQNFRNTKQIFEFAKLFVPDDPSVNIINTSNMENGNKPRIKTGESESNQLDLIWDIVQENLNANIGILVHFKKQVKIIRNYFRDKELIDDSDNDMFSYYYNRMPHPDLERFENKLLTPFITTFDSCKGLEFDIVILPLFEISDWAMRTTRNRQDENGDWTIVEYNADDTEKKWATRNHYYVACTRAKRDLYLFCREEPEVLPSFDSNTYLKNGVRYN